MSATLIALDANVARQGAAKYETTIRMTDTSNSGWANTIKGMPRVGDMAERRRATKMRDIEAFSEMTGDRNPIHYDRELAASALAAQPRGGGTGNPVEDQEPVPARDDSASSPRIRLSN